jgi:hypothetical protein
MFQRKCKDYLSGPMGYLSAYNTVVAFVSEDNMCSTIWSIELACSSARNIDTHLFVDIACYGKVGPQKRDVDVQRSENTMNDSVKMAQVVH